MDGTVRFQWYRYVPWDSVILGQLSGKNNGDAW